MISIAVAKACDPFVYCVCIQANNRDIACSMFGKSSVPRFTEAPGELRAVPSYTDTYKYFLVKSFLFIGLYK